MQPDAPLLPAHVHRAPLQARGVCRGRSGRGGGAPAGQRCSAPTCCQGPSRSSGSSVAGSGCCRSATACRCRMPHTGCHRSRSTGRVLGTAAPAAVPTCPSLPSTALLVPKWTCPQAVAEACGVQRLPTYQVYHQGALVDVSRGRCLQAWKAMGGAAWPSCQPPDGLTLPGYAELQRRPAGPRACHAARCAHSAPP